MGVCPACGLDEDAISVPDALDALRSFPRRYRDALGGVEADVLRTRPEPSTWSMLEYAVHVREVLELLGAGLDLVLEHPGIELPAVDVDEVSVQRPAWTLDATLALGGIERAAGALVARADATPWEAWSRPFTVGGDGHTAGWIPAHAAHEGAHHLRDIARVRARVAPEG